MIVITTGSGKLTVTGHAGYAPPGQDIVCAGVSALTQTLAAALDTLADENIHCELSLGRTVIQWEESTEQLRLLVGSFLLGAKGIAGQYPECVRLIENAGDGAAKP